MANRKILFNEHELMAINTQAAMDLLTLCLEVIRRNHPVHDNMVLIGGKSWWVITSTASEAIDFEKATLEEPATLLAKIREVRSGLLIVRQLDNNRVSLTFISELDELEKQLKQNPSMDWSSIEKIQMFSDVGAQSESGECIGFEMIKARGQDRVLMSPTEI